jgi:CRISPR-associated endonuclease/helicase Cas3
LSSIVIIVFSVNIARVPFPRKLGIPPLAPVESAPRHEDCWAKTTKDGKPGISVRDHCLNVGCVAEALLTLLPPQLEALQPRGASTFAALHDLGKVSPGFQVKCETWLQESGLKRRADSEGWYVEESDHAKVSQSTIQDLLHDTSLSRWAAAVGAHHGRIKGEQVPMCKPWHAERLRLANELIDGFGELPKGCGTEALIWFVAGLITVADWIGSDERHFPQDVAWDMSQRRSRARTTLAAIGWQPVKPKVLTSFSELFPEIPCPNGLQKVSMELVSKPGVYVIEGPMGYGKTEASLAAAYQLVRDGKATGIYFALPTQITSNRIFLRLEPFVGRISREPADTRLAHSSSWLFESEPPAQLSPAVLGDKEAKIHVRDGRSWFASAKRALLSSYGVGTIDQALLGIVAAKHFFVRQFGLAGKVVILDEVHTYDLYTSTLLDELVKRLRELHCTVIILSATLTKKRRRGLLGLSETNTLSEAYPLVSGVHSSAVECGCEPPPPKTVNIRNIAGATSVTEALEHARHGECILWMRNTIDEAQETYRALRSATPVAGPTVALLHSRFPFFRREQLEDEWMTRLGKDSAQRPNGCILVSTQVAEQSVDIDADLLITDLAPTDMLLQRLGRLWRHARKHRPALHPEVWIKVPSVDATSLLAVSEKELRECLGKSARVYAPYVLLRSLQQWRSRAQVTLPDDIRSVLEDTYAEPMINEPIAWRRLREQLEKQKETMANLALGATRIWTNPALQDEESIQTRYGSYRTAQLLLATGITPHGHDTIELQMLDGTEVRPHTREWSFEAAKAIHRNIARVPYWTVVAGLEKSPSWLANYVTQPTAIGLVKRDASIIWSDDDRPTGLSYCADQGIITDRQKMKAAAYEEFDESYD